MTQEETDGDDKPTTRSTTTKTASTPFRQKYVTLSRNKNRDSSGLSSTSSTTTIPSTTPPPTTRNANTKPVASSSTETSVVVRYSKDDAFILPDSVDNGEQVHSGDDNEDSNAKAINRASSFVARLLSSGSSSSPSLNGSPDNGDKSSNRYVTISRPYARVAGTSVTEGGEEAVEDSTGGTLSPQGSRLRYVARV